MTCAKYHSIDFHTKKILSIFSEFHIRQGDYTYSSVVSYFREAQHNICDTIFMWYCLGFLNVFSLLGPGLGVSYLLSESICSK